MSRRAIPNQGEYVSRSPFISIGIAVFAGLNCLTVLYNFLDPPEPSNTGLPGHHRSIFPETFDDYPPSKHKLSFSPAKLVQALVTSWANRPPLLFGARLPSTGLFFQGAERNLLVEYLTGAKELREGVAKLPTPNTASPDTVRAMSLDLFFDYLAVRLNGPKAANAKMKLNFDFGNGGGKYLVELENGVLNHTASIQSDKADATLSLSRDTLNNIILKQTSLDDAIKAGNVKVSGDEGKVKELVSYLDNFDFWFNIVTP